MKRLIQILMLVMTIGSVFAGELYDIAFTVYKEASGESYVGKVAVATVIYNRALKSGNTFGFECKKNMQFSCWNAVDKNHPTIKLNNQLDRKAWNECVSIAIQMIDCNFEPSGSWNHYYNPDKANPSWGKLMTNVNVIGHHKFGVL